MRRLPIIGLVLVTLGVLLGVGTAPADAGSEPLSGPFVDVVKVDGLLDPIMVDFLHTALDDAEAAESVGLVLQLDSDGAVVADDELVDLLARFRSSSVPVSVWIGPSNSRATGGAALLAGAAAEVGMAPGTAWGLGETAVPPEALDLMVRDVPVRAVSAGEAEDQGLLSFPGETIDGVVSLGSPTIGDFIVNLPQVESTEITVDDGQVRREPVTPVRFSALPLGVSLLHAVASPAVAYLLFVAGLTLLIFELFTAGVGVAGMVGAGSFVAGCYGLATLPVHWWAVALLVASMGAFAVDVQTGVPRFWTGAGFLLFVVGTLTLYDGVSMSWITIGFGFIGVLLAFLTGMPSMVRTRFSTPTIGREWMVGEMGRAVTEVSPDGVVQVREALWRATTNRATPIEELDRVRVVGIDGLVLEVEPEEGGARDYRERGGASSD